jgi:sulfhydrogenase subunit delta
MALRVVVVGLASDFGCQVQMTNIEDDLLDVLGLVDLKYWQLAASGDMPDAFDVAVVEGAVTTDEHVETLKRVREEASVVIALGSCAITGGIPALAGIGPDLDCRYAEVYGADGPQVARGRRTPVPVTAVIPVDYIVPGCPIDTAEYLHVLSRALRGLSDKTPDMPMCASCKTKENVCFIQGGTLCLGLVTRSGCGAVCTTLGRPCTGCRGIAPDANLESARRVFAAKGWDLDRMLAALQLYNADRKVAL